MIADSGGFLILSEEMLFLSLVSYEEVITLVIIDFFLTELEL